MAETRTQEESMNTIELEAGPELDAAVAKAIGLTCRILEAPCADLRSRHRVCVNTGKPCWEPFEPSNDLNAAFEVAEKAGLFERYCLNKSPSGWDFRIACDEMCPPYLIEDCPTAAVAICRAILKLKAAK